MVLFSRLRLLAASNLGVWVFSLRQVMVEPQHRGNGLGVANRAPRYHADRRWQRNEPLVDYFVLFRLRRSFAQTGSQVDSHSLGYESRTRVELQNAPPACGCISGLLQ